MLLAGLQRLKADGAAVAKLNVDAENPTGALRLYESVGFRVAHSWQSYSKELHTV
jgi:ribosomal protein S18 acetylase RimI-like enzyme